MNGEAHGAGLVPANAPVGSGVIDRGSHALAVGAMQTRANLVLELMANVLEEKKDYGKIPGTDKPTLFKPGAEKLGMAFQLAPDRPTVDDLSVPGDEIRYRLHVPIVDRAGTVISVGVGEASTNEEKYRWRKPVCDQEWDETSLDLRREKWFKGGSNGAWKGKQIRTSPADLANTVLKMAHKRAFIHGMLMATAASSVFNQDLEDFTKELLDSVIEEDGDGTPERKEPQRKSASAPAPAASSAPRRSTAAAPAPGSLLKVGYVQRVWKSDKANRKPAAIILKGSETKYTTFSETLEAEAKQFEGTDHQVCLSYTVTEKGGNTYCNAVGIAIADAAPATTPAATEPLGADDIFGGAGRQPGEEG